MSMTCKERTANALARKPVDHCPCFEHIWPETNERWIAEGKVPENPDYVEIFNWDMRGAGWMNSIADIDFEEQVIEENDETRLVLDGNGAKLRRHKHLSRTPEHVDFTVKDRDAWEAHIKPHLLKTDRRRIDFDAYGEARQRAADEQRYFWRAGVGPFEQMHPMCGHEYMLMGMALDPDWVRDMVQTYVDMSIRHLELLFGEKGVPDGFFFFEDMGFKQKPFMSPAMYRDIVQPGHKRLFDYAHDHGCPVVVHSCGFVDPLVEGMIEAGMDCLQAMEVKAGMDLVDLARRYGDKISFFGGLDVRALISNDREKIKAEMDSTIGELMKMNAGYVIHSDHSIPPEVDFETLQYFFDYGRELTSRST